jgi:hypothetical protein
LEAEEPIRGNYGSRAIPELGIICRNNEIDVAIIWNRFVHSVTNEVTFRFDKEKPIKIVCPRSMNFEENQLDDQSVSFIKMMLSHQSLLARILDSDGSEFIAKFDIRDLDKALEPIIQKCPLK